MVSIPRCPGKQSSIGSPLQCSCLENLMDRGAWQGLQRMRHDLATEPQQYSMIYMCVYICVCVCTCVCVYHNFFIRSSVDGHLGCFYVLAIVNSAAVNTWVQVSFSCMGFSGCVPCSGIAESYGSFIPSFLSNLPTVLHNGCINLHSLFSTFSPACIYYL